MTIIRVLNGPNLQSLGAREPEIYGTQNLDELADLLRKNTPPGVSLDFRQTDNESELISWIHQAREERTAVILNPAAFTHYSYALRDAVAMLSSEKIPVIEVHLTNPHARENFRHTSVISGVALGVIAGFGVESYRLALDFLCDHLSLR